jgi:hypothetical protein
MPCPPTRSMVTGHGSRPFSNREARQFTGVELQTSDAQLKRTAHREFRVQAAT